MSRILAGPWAGQLLGDYGADIVKIERPLGGDDTRQWGPPWFGDSAARESAYFLAANRNKRSVTVDFSTPGGQRLIRDLAEKADILLENFKVGTLQRYGLDYTALHELNPRLIYCSISAFGQKSSRAAEPGYDAMIQASAGLMSITGPAETDGAGPQKVGVAVADIMAGMYAVTAILAALSARERTGEGQFIDVPLYDSQVAWLANQNMNYLISGTAPGRMGTAHPNLVPYQAFRTADGSLILAVGNDRQFAHCASAIGQPEIGSDPRFVHNSDRVANRKALVELLQEALAKKPTQYWLGEFGKHRVPVGPINDIKEVLGNDYARERHLVQYLENADGESVPTVANPVDFSVTPVRYAFAPPRLGEHTDEVLRDWLGYSDESIAELRKHSII